jgi:hypothetical protein
MEKALGRTASFVGDFVLLVKTGRSSFQRDSIEHSVTIRFQ